MALKINRELTTKDGGVVASGSCAVFSTQFPAIGYDYIARVQVYRSQAAKEANATPLDVVELTQLNFRKSLTLSDFAELTPIVIHDHVKAFLEDQLGSGTVEVLL